MKSQHAVDALGKKWHPNRIRSFQVQELRRYLKIFIEKLQAAAKEGRLLCFLSSDWECGKDSALPDRVREGVSFLALVLFHMLQSAILECMKGVLNVIFRSQT